MIASIFPRSTAIPSLLTMHPSRVPLVTLNAHLAGLRLSRVVRHHSKHNRRWCKWSFAHPVYRKIIQEYLQKGWDVLTEYFRNDSLECCRHGFQPKRHDHCYEYPPFYYKGRLLLVVRMHADFVIPAEPGPRSCTSCALRRRLVRYP